MHTCNHTQSVHLSTHLSIYSIIYFYQYGLKDIYFIHWIIMHCFFIFLFKFFQFWLLGTISVSSYALLTYFHHFICVCACVAFFFLILFLFSGTMRHSRLILYMLFSSPKVSHFSKKPWFIVLKNDVRNQNSCSRYPRCY